MIKSYLFCLFICLKEPLHIYPLQYNDLNTVHDPQYEIHLTPRYWIQRTCRLLCKQMLIKLYTCAMHLIFPCHHIVLNLARNHRSNFTATTGDSFDIHKTLLCEAFLDNPSALFLHLFKLVQLLSLLQLAQFIPIKYIVHLICLPVAN